MRTPHGCRFSPEVVVAALLHLLAESRDRCSTYARRAWLGSCIFFCLHSTTSTFRRQQFRAVSPDIAMLKVDVQRMKRRTPDC